MSAIEYTFSMEPRIVKFVKLENGEEPCLKWLTSLDKVTKARIKSRLTRLLEGNFGDFKKIDDEISELRFKFGSGYRIYYTEIDNVIVLLINGGDKSTQSKDIAKAKGMEEIIMENLKHTTDLENFLINDLQSDEDIKLFLNASLKDYLEDGDFNSFYRALEIVIKAKDTVSGFAKKVGLSRSNLYSIFKNEKEPKFSTIAKIFQELGYELEVA